eukprot:scaffold133443_cov67-Phaeocystis_antarctica.AAC.1
MHGLPQLPTLLTHAYLPVGAHEGRVGRHEAEAHVDDVVERELLVVEVAAALRRVLQQQVHAEGEAEHHQPEQ